MKIERMTTMAMAAAARCCCMSMALAALIVTPRALAAQMDTETWRLTAAVGGFVPREAIIVGADGRDTRLAAGPSFSLELQYIARTAIAVYGNLTAGFSSMTLGTDIAPTSFDTAEPTTVFAGTVGVMLSPTGLLGDRILPTFRLGGGVKAYFIDVNRADNLIRPTADIGIGFRGVGTGPLEMSAEVRLLPSAFDQSALPTRGIATQNQRQTDLVFTVGLAIRP